MRAKKIRVSSAKSKVQAHICLSVISCLFCGYSSQSLFYLSTPHFIVYTEVDSPLTSNSNFPNPKHSQNQKQLKVYCSKFLFDSEFIIYLTLHLNFKSANFTGPSSSSSRFCRSTLFCAWKLIGNILYFMEKLTQNPQIAPNLNKVSFVVLSSFLSSPYFIAISYKL